MSEEDCYKCIGKISNRRCEKAETCDKTTHKGLLNCELRCGTRADTKMWEYGITYTDEAGDLLSYVHKHNHEHKIRPINSPEVHHEKEHSNKKTNKTNANNTNNASMENAIRQKELSSTIMNMETIMKMMTNSDDVAVFISIYVGILVLNIAFTVLGLRIRSNCEKYQPGSAHSVLIVLSLITMWISGFIPYVGLPTYVLNLIGFLCILLSSKNCS
jgi:hypothetical protein